MGYPEITNQDNPFFILEKKGLKTMHVGEFDGSFSATKGAKAGILIRNKKGKTIFKETITLYDVKNSMEAEWVALLQLLRKVMKLGLKSVKIVGDCLNIIQMVKKKESKNRYKKYTDKIYEILKYIKRCDFEWVRREMNKQAHKLAAKRLRSDIVVWSPVNKKQNNKIGLNIMFASPRLKERV